MTPTNEEFLQAIFGDMYHYAHCTSFMEDPTDIPNEKRAKCWGGNYWMRTSINPDANTYYTVSLFSPDDEGKARRRKALFSSQFIIVADDVREKLPIEQVEKLPLPTYKLETSPGSEQWAWLLDTPCTDRQRVENLLDGLIKQGLAPDSRDPGMAGVCRYIRLPNGINSKQKRIDANNGVAPLCELTEWNPDRRVSLEQLAAPFDIDLNAKRHDGRVDGAADLPDHPILNHVEVKSVLSEGRYDITCPWVGEHTGQIDDGCAVFTNEDGTIGMQCHHGCCTERTGKDLLDRISQTVPDIRQTLKVYQVSKSFGVEQPVTHSENVEDPLVTAYNTFKSTSVASPEATNMAGNLLHLVDDMPYINKLQWHDRIREHMGWTKSDLVRIIKDEREKWYANSFNAGAANDVYSTHTFVKSQGGFFHHSKNIFSNPTDFRNSYVDVDPDILANALEGRCVKVDKIQYMPGQARHFEEKGITYLNTWTDDTDYGTPGDCQPWIDHFKALGFSDAERDHLINYMAFTLQHQDIKINHGIIICGGEGIGKDMVVDPLKRAMGNNKTEIHSKELCDSSGYNDFVLNTKLLCVGELDSGNHKDAEMIQNQFKAYAAAPPDTLRVKKRYCDGIEIKNIMSVIGTSNYMNPIKVSGDARRLFILWSDLDIKDHSTGVISEEWAKYFKDFWEWLNKGGWRHCVHYMANLDLSKFDPKHAPPNTEALDDAKDLSQDPLISIFQECVFDEIGLFKSDLLSIKDIHLTFRTLDTGTMGYNLKMIPSVKVLGKVIKQNNAATVVRAYRDRKDIKIFVVRNVTKYMGMDKQELIRHYEAQISSAASSKHLTVVKGGL